MELKINNMLPEHEILLEAGKDKTTVSSDTSILFEGDNFKALSILLNSHRGMIDLVYIDPPFNTEQAFFMSESGRANSVSSSRNGIVAYSDKLSTDDYLEFIRERLVLIRELLSDRGSIYLHIDCKIGHYVKIVMDEVFGRENFKNDITRIKSNPKNFFRKAYGNEKDLILFYAKNYGSNIWNDVRIPLDSDEIESRFNRIAPDGRRYTTIPLHAPGETKDGVTGIPWRGINVPEGRHWRTSPEKFDELDREGLIEWSSAGNPRIIKYADEHKGKKIQDIWKFKDPQKPIYPTQKNLKMLEQIVLQSSNPDSLVLDCFAGSGAFLKAAQNLNRRWVGVDNSPAAISVIKSQNLSDYKFIELPRLF